MTQREPEVEAFVTGLASILESRSAIYVSSPLTSGRRAAEWHSTNGGKENPESFRANVFTPNQADAAAYVRHLRVRTGRQVIDPGAVDDIEDWTQDDYRVCWGRVIQEYVETVVFRDGWQYSSGCAYEFVVAHEAGLEIVSEDWSRLSLEDGRALLIAAADDLRSQSGSVAFLEGLLRALYASSAAT